MKMNTVLDSLELCCGCGLCEKICPKQAVSMKENHNGNIVPTIDEGKCIDCGLCKKKCITLNPETFMECEEAYAAYAGQEDILKRGSSGGVFGALAYRFLNSGIVYGAEMNEEARVFHSGIDKVSQLDKLQGSKYVQSDIRPVLNEIAEKLTEDKAVLFCGTPCQVAAVKRLTNDPANLYTIDLICHGVPNQRMFREFLTKLETLFLGKISDFKFRDKYAKSMYCSSFFVKRPMGKQKVYVRSGYISFYSYFLHGEILRENCYKCPYAQGKRVGNITIGDYWGIEDCHKELVEQHPDVFSWSAILVNDEKGKKLLKNFGQDLRLFETEFQKIAAQNGQLVKPSKKPDNYEELKGIYEKKGYSGLEKMFRNTHGGELKYRWHLFRQLLKKGRK